jgi:hypothetical protein
MINLHEVMPEFFTEREIVPVDLDGLYRKYCPHSHMAALEMIFAEGVRYSDEVAGHNASEVDALHNRIVEMEFQYESQLKELRLQLTTLEEKYNSFLAKLNPVGVSEDAERIAVTQTLGMGNVFK